MTTASINQYHSSTQGLANWLISKSNEQSAVSKIKYHLGGRVALVGASLLCLVEAVCRAVVGCMAFLGYVITLGCWQQARNFASEQTQKAGRAGSASLDCFRSIISPKELINCIPMAKPPVPHLIEPHVSVPQESLTDILRSRQIRQGTENIANKLRKQFEHAQNQAAQEPDKAFKYLAAPANFKGHAHTEKVPGYEVGVCHYIGRRPTMEDEHLTTSFDLKVGDKVYPVQLFGIFDGHGGKEASRYVKENLERKLHETLNEFCVGGLTDEAIWNALKITSVRLKEEFKERISGTTSTMVMILDGKLWTANVGDARTILDNDIQLSEDAKPKDPRYQNGIEKRGGQVIEDPNGTHRVNGILAVARAIGDHIVGAISARPKITVYLLSMIPKGTHLILTCDGVYDVASTRQVAAAVRAHKDQPAVDLAKNIVYSAYKAMSGDNLSALVVKL